MPNKSLSRSGLLTYQKYSSLLAGNDPYIPFTSSYDLLETEILTGTQASVTFSSLNSTYGADYQHLQIRMTARTDRPSGSNADVYVNLNADSGSNYAYHGLLRTTSLSSFGASSQARGYLGGVPVNATTANAFAGYVYDILDPFETTKYTTIRALGGFATGFLGLHSTLWMNTNALTSIELSSEADFVTGSRFSLYGLKASA